MYADYSYYAETFRGGMEPLIPEAEHAFLERQAEEWIRYATQRRSDGVSCEELENCTCELAEFLYEAHRASQTATEAGGAGLLTSYSNDGESGSFHVQDSPYTESGQRQKISAIIRKHLLWTGLLFRGVAR